MVANAGIRHSAILLAMCVTAQSAYCGELTLSADSPVVSIETRTDGRNFVRLPSVDYQFNVRAMCDVGMQPRSVSLNIADTRVLLAQDAFEGDAPVNVSVRIPANQIAPVALDGFCAAAPAESTPQKNQQINVPGILSVQASLRCASDDSSEVVYASRALDVSLRCRLPDDESVPAVKSVGSR
jgi:hypothetical protein